MKSIRLILLALVLAAAAAPAQARPISRPRCTQTVATPEPVQYAPSQWLARLLHQIRAVLFLA